MNKRTGEQENGSPNSRKCQSSDLKRSSFRFGQITREAQQCFTTQGQLKKEQFDVLKRLKGSYL